MPAIFSVFRAFFPKILRLIGLYRAVWRVKFKRPAKPQTAAGSWKETPDYGNHRYS
jgi:hypothetical protein